eukprot:9491147-Pyramimonas_sp.AAC.2
MYRAAAAGSNGNIQLAGSCPLLNKQLLNKQLLNKRIPKRRNSRSSGYTRSRRQLYPPRAAHAVDDSALSPRGSA